MNEEVIAGLIIWYGIVVLPLLLSAILVMSIPTMRTPGFAILLVVFILGSAPFIEIIQQNKILGAIITVIIVLAFPVLLSIDEVETNKNKI